jgi:hypothetical protein
MSPSPDLEMRSPAAANGRAKQKIQSSSTEVLAQSLRDFQALKLQNRFALCPATAETVAALAWGVPHD